MSISIVNYSEKAIAVFGNTKEIKDHLLSIGGKFNPSLKQNEERVAGWIFPSSKRDEVKKIITAYSQGSLEPVKIEKEPYVKKKEQTESPSFDISKEMYLALISRIECLEAEIKICKKVIDKLTDSPPEVVPKKRVQPTLKFSENDNLYDGDEEKEYKSLFKSK